MTMAVDKQDKVLNVPTLRFPEFKDEWQKCNVGDYGEVITGNTPPTGDHINYADGTHLWASPADLGKTKFVTDTSTKLSSIGFNKTRKLPEGSILVTCIGSTIGKMGMAATEMSTNQQINSIIVNAQNDKHFVYYALQSRFPRYLTSVAIQAVPIMSKSSFEKQQNYRTTLEEQKKIGFLLNLIDERISTQIRIIEDLKQLRSALYYQIFSNIQGNWVTLKMVGDIAKGKQINGTELLDEGMYYVMNGGITPSGYYNNYNTPANTISISEGGNSCGYVQYNSVPFWSGGHCYNLRIKKSFDSQYIFHFLKFKELDIMALRIGSGLPNIQKKDLEHFQVLVPDFTTQKKVSGLFVLINKKEETEMKLMNAWKMQKKYLLQKLFI